MIRKMILAALFATLVSPFNHSKGGEPAGTAFDDAEFVKAVAIAGLYDVCLGDHIGSQTRNDAVRKFAVGIVADHIVAAPAMKSVAKEVGVELPGKLDDTHQKQFETFKVYQGEDLERDFVKSVVKRYTLGVAAFTRVSKEAKNPALKAFAAAAIPKLQKRLEEAKNLDK
jgi:putative membrane protein